MHNSLGVVAFVHASIYFLLAGAPFILYHYRRRLFLGSMGVVATLVYTGAVIGGDGGDGRRLAAAVVVVLCGGPLMVIAISVLLEGRSHFSWAVATYAIEVFLLRIAALPNELTHGDAGRRSPFEQGRPYTFFVAMCAVLFWAALLMLARRRHLLWHAERDLESPRLTAVLGIGGWRARIIPAALAGASLALAAVVFLLWQPRIQPAGFALCSSLVALTAALILNSPRTIALFAFAVTFVVIRVAVGFFGGAASTQVSEMIGGLAIIILVAGKTITRSGIFTMVRRASKV